MTTGSRAIRNFRQIFAEGVHAGARRATYYGSAPAMRLLCAQDAQQAVGQVQRAFEQTPPSETDAAVNPIGENLMPPRQEPVRKRAEFAALAYAALDQLEAATQELPVGPTSSEMTDLVLRFRNRFTELVNELKPEDTD